MMLHKSDWKSYWSTIHLILHRFKHLIMLDRSIGIINKAVASVRGWDSASGGRTVSMAQPLISTDGSVYLSRLPGRFRSGRMLSLGPSRGQQQSSRPHVLEDQSEHHNTDQNEYNGRQQFGRTVGITGFGRLNDSWRTPLDGEISCQSRKCQRLGECQLVHGTCKQSKFQLTTKNYKKNLVKAFKFWIY